jgi:hypothetical protein
MAKISQPGIFNFYFLSDINEENEMGQACTLERGLNACKFLVRILEGKRAKNGRMY